MERILLFLPVKDAARTETLSTHWRHQWKGIPQLNFNADFARVPGVGSYEPNANTVVLRIYKALLTHDGPITRVVLAIPGLRPIHDIDHLILHLSNKGVKEFVIRFGDEMNGYPYLDCDVSSSLFAARELVSLKLQGCTLKAPSWFVGFSKLTRLVLNNVYLPSDFFTHFLPKCPLLEQSRLLHCDQFVNTEILAPSLKLLSIQSTLYRICFKYAPLLSVVSILDADEFSDYRFTTFQQYDPDMVALFTSLPELRQLTIGTGFLLFLAAGQVPYKLPTHLHHLKVLKIHLLLYRWPEARVLVCLIMSSPNLQTLSIQLDTLDYHPPSKVTDSLDKLLKAKDQHGSGCCFQCLEELKIWGSRGMQVELDLIRFVLATAPLLCKIHIEPRSELNCDVVLKFLMQLSRYERVSERAEIIYLWKYEG
ncbi:unnamed protein product [Linum tenue]|uniref:FBD domain-containing protein n=2 Tax=Linum tenue TaxID=586396 RepID=A0AAV0R688_9ROSI|nr:unnamed protein product [Linum tenue]